jgi:hypothetical protein
MDKVFAKGFSFKRNDNAPEFVVGKLSLKADEAIQFIKDNSSNGWVNLDVKKSKEGKFYIELDTFKKESKIEEGLPF